MSKQILTMFFRNDQYLLIIQDNVRDPNHLRWDSDRCYIIKIRGPPAQFIIIPFLQQSHREKVHKN